MGKIVKLAKSLTQDVYVTPAQIPMDENRPAYGHLDMQRKELLTQKMASSLF